MSDSVLGTGARMVVRNVWSCVPRILVRETNINQTLPKWMESYACDTCWEGKVYLGQLWSGWGAQEGSPEDVRFGLRPYAWREWRGAHPSEGTAETKPRRGRARCFWGTLEQKARGTMGRGGPRGRAGRIRVEDVVRILRRSEANEEMKRFEWGGAIYSYTWQVCSFKASWWRVKLRGSWLESSWVLPLIWRWRWPLLPFGKRKHYYGISLCVVCMCKLSNTDV